GGRGGVGGGVWGGRGREVGGGGGGVGGAGGGRRGPAGSARGPALAGWAPPCSTFPLTTRSSSSRARPAVNRRSGSLRSRPVRTRSSAPAFSGRCGSSVITAAEVANSVSRRNGERPSTAK